MEHTENTTFLIYFAQVSGSSMCAIVIAYAVLTVIHNEINDLFFIHYFINTIDFNRLYLPFYFLLFGMLVEILVACLLGNFVELTVRFTIKKNLGFSYD